MTTPLGTVQVTRLDTGETRTLVADTLFEAFRKEFFRKTIPSQRDAISITNIPGEGTLATEGVWRREMADFSSGAGQYALDKKGDEDPARFFASKGLDVFTYPQRATLLPDTHSVISATGANLLMTRCGDYLVVAAGGSVSSYNSSYALVTTYTAGSTYGGTAWTVVNSITSNDSYCFIATDTGIWFAKIGTDTQFQLYAAPDGSTGYTGGYSMVRWANDQLIAAQNARLYAFAPRSTSGGTPFGSPPSIINPSYTPISIVSVTNSGTTANVVTATAHQLTAGQQIAITGSKNYAAVSGVSLTSGVMTVTTTSDHGFQVGQTVQVKLFFTGVPNGRLETTTVQSVPSATTFTYNATKVGAAAIATGFTSGWTEATNPSANYGYNQNWTVTSVTNATTFVITGAIATFGNLAYGGTVTVPSESGIYMPDMLVTHNNVEWVWSDATGGQTQIYFSGYVKGASANHSGAVYRSDMLGSSTSATSGYQVVTSASVAQPWVLDTPLQALPMSPDEYPVCLKAYLNYIFIGSNRGIRMAQTLSVYDPTATATGDLKAGPLIPNNLQPVGFPVSAIVGDGRYVWFAWSNYDGTSTGTGKLNLQQFIAQDPLAPVYASDLMVTGQGMVTALEWDPVNNIPLVAVQGLGVYAPYATNEGGNLTATQYVPSGTLSSSFYNFGIAEPKIPVFFDYGVYLPAGGGSCAANVVMDPHSASPVTITVPSYTSNSEAIEQSIYQTGGTNDRGREFQTTLTVTTSNTAQTPVLFRWTMKAYPTPVQGTFIGAVVLLTKSATADGHKYPMDPEEQYNWLESLRWNQTLLTYQVGGTSVLCVINTINDIPDKSRGDFPGGFEGSVAVEFKTLAPFVYTAPVLS